MGAGIVQERYDWTSIRPSDTGRSENKWGGCDHEDVWYISTSFKVVGFGGSV